MADTQLILHVKGTEQTTALPRPVVREGIKQGQISRSQLIWSPLHNAWKQVRELPELWPSQKLAPAPMPRVIAPQVSVTSAHLPKVASQPAPAAQARIAGPPKVTVPAAQPRIAGTGPVPKIAGAPAAPPRVAAPARARPAFSAADEPLPGDDLGLTVAKWLCVGVGGALLLVIAVNYLLVDQPLDTKFAATPFRGVGVHAHLGAFVQPDAVVIHIAKSPEVTAENFASFLVALARSTPTRIGSGESYDRVSLTPGWTGDYSFSGVAWDELGKMGADDEEKQRAFILDQLDSASGQPVAGSAAAPEVRAQAWETFVRDFTRS
jgi:hypothetical protein